MGKRRTKKEKQKAKHPFKISWDPNVSGRENEAKINPYEPDVKGQFSGLNLSSDSKKTNLKKDYSSAHTADFELVRKDLVKSLALAGLIVSLEVVLYLKL